MRPPLTRARREGSATSSTACAGFVPVRQFYSMSSVTEQATARTRESSAVLFGDGGCDRQLGGCKIFERHTDRLEERDCGALSRRSSRALASRQFEEIAR